MTSETAKDLDFKYNRMQWAGEEYILEEIVSNNSEALKKDGEVFRDDVLYWMGYLYQYWHYYSGETGLKIYEQALVDTMKRNYMIFHTMDPVVAIEDLKEIYKQE